MAEASAPSATHESTPHETATPAHAAESARSLEGAGSEHARAPTDPSEDEEPVEQE